jgi:hypothetical protein
MDFRGDICLGMKELMSQYDELKRLLDSASGERTVVNWLKESRENTLVLSRTVSTFGFRISSSPNFSLVPIIRRISSFLGAIPAGFRFILWKLNLRTSLSIPRRECLMLDWPVRLSKSRTGSPLKRLEGWSLSTSWRSPLRTGSFSGGSHALLSRTQASAFTIRPFGCNFTTTL